MGGTMTWSTIETKKLAELKATVAAQEDMLKHASDTIARLEERWRAPGVLVEDGKRALVVQQKTLRVISCEYAEDWGSWQCQGRRIDILAWCELPAIPADDSYGDLK
jgi:hypothetical protein